MAKVRKKRNLSTTTWTILGSLAAITVIGALTYGVARAARRGKVVVPPRYPPDPQAPSAPLRPEPTAPEQPPPGRLARRLRSLLDGLTDAQLQSVRNAMPPAWWAYLINATYMPSDEAFAFALQPMSIDLAIWTEEQRQQLQTDLVSALGIMNALELKEILEAANAAVGGDVS